MVIFFDVVKARQEVQAEYDNTISNFLNDVRPNGGGLSNILRSPLDDLLSWATQLVKDNQNLEARNTAAASRLKSETARFKTDLQSQAHDLNEQFRVRYEESQKRLNKFADLLQRREAECDERIKKTEDDARARIQREEQRSEERVKALTESYEGKLAKGREELNSLQREMSALDERWKKYTDALQFDHETTVTKQKRQHDETVCNLDGRWQTSVVSLQADHSETLQNLRAQLMSHGKVDQGWNDYRLTECFRDIMVAVDVLASNSTFNSLGTEPRPVQHLDPSGFLTRNTDAEFSPLLLRSHIWSILREGFFSLPYGFGSLGPQFSESFEGFCYQWQRVLLAEEPIGSLERLFGKDLESNMWRSATMVSVSKSIRAKATGIGQAYQANMANVSTQLGAVWRDFFGGLEPDQKTSESLESITAQAGELALQFGVHKARISLVFPPTQSEVTYGSEIYHYRNGGQEKGKTAVADLVCCPGLLRVGDGRRDVSVQMPLSPAKVVPRET